MFAMFGASALIALTSLIAKSLGPEGTQTPLHPLQVSAGRFVFALLVLGAVSLWRRPSFAGTLWPLHAVRAACGWLGVTCLFAAAARMPLSDATAISFLSPLVTVLLAAVILKERVGWERWLAVALACVGAFILIQPGAEAFRPIAFIALAAAGLMGLEAIFIKRLSEHEPPMRILLINNFFGAVIATSVALFFWQPPTPQQWFLLAVLGLAMVCAQRLFIQAMKSGDASLVMPVFYSALLFATLYDFVIFDVLPGPVAAAGAGLIVCGVLLLTFLGRKHLASQPLRPTAE